MKNYSLQELKGKYQYEYDGKINIAYGACSNKEIASCQADNIKEAILKLKEKCPVELDKSGYGMDGLISYQICEGI